MITVADAERIISQHTKDYGTEQLSFDLAMGRVLAENINADRDLPPCNRVTMDGIAICHSAFEFGVRDFRIKATIAAGDAPVEINHSNECIEIMTGAALPGTVDTVIRYEDLEIKNGIASVIIDNIAKGQNIHTKGKDKKKDDVVAAANQIIDPALISMAASVGKSKLVIKKLPTVVIISTGDELVAIDERPNPYQVRSSNNYTIKSALQRYGIHCDMLHLPDDPKITAEKIKQCLEKYDVLLLTGGISMGKFDYIPRSLEELSVTKLFHKVQQRPGKPFWFGAHENGVLVFAFPGNPVSTFLCLHRYFIPWLELSLQIPNLPAGGQVPKYAILNRDFTFPAKLQYFLQVNVSLSDQGQLLADPMEGNGSGDFANLLDSNAFMELPMEQDNFNKGAAYRIWPFKQII